MATENELRAEFLRHKREEWEKFFRTPEWETLTTRGQEMADVLQNQLVSMPVSGMDDLLKLLDIRSELRGVLKNSMLPVEVIREINDELEQLTREGE